MKRVNRKGKGKTMVTAWMLSILMAVSPCMSTQAYAEETVAAEASIEAPGQEPDEVSAEEATQEVAEVSTEAVGQEVAGEGIEATEPKAPEEVASGNPQEDAEVLPNAGGVAIDTSTGTLVLAGEVDKDTVQSYASDKRITRVYANKGAVLPKNCAGLFMNFTQITSINLSNVDSSNVENMDFMFANCKAMESINLSGFNTEKVTTMKMMFGGCEALRCLELYSFNTKKVYYFTAMFMNCTNLKTLNISSFETDEARDMDSMFKNSGVTSLDLSGFNTQYVISFTQMFQGCDALTSLDLSTFNTSKMKNCEEMFDGAMKLQTIYVSTAWSTGNVQNGANMFRGCTSLVGQNGTTYNGNYVGVSYARIDKSNSPGYFTSRNPVEITRQPQSVTSDIGGEISLSVVAEGALSYKWHFLNANGEDLNWATVESCGYGTAVGDSYEESFQKSTLRIKDIGEGMEGGRVYCEITGKCGYVTYSDRATIHVSKKVQKVYIEFYNFKDACAGKYVESLSSAYLTSASGRRVGYGTVAVEWTLFGKKMTEGPLGLHDTMEIRFSVDLVDGYEFANTRVGYVNNPRIGDPIPIDRITGPETPTHSVFTLEYDVPAPKGGVKITEIRREIAVPVSGEELPTELVALSRLEDRQRNYTVQSVSWTHVEWEGYGSLEDQSNEMALGGDEYILEIVYKAKAEYCFYEYSSFYINGEAMRIVELDPSEGGTVKISRIIRVAEDVGTIWSVSANFAGMIELNYYCEMPKRILQDEKAYVLMQMEEGTSVAVLVKDAKNKTVGGHSTKMFSFPVVAKKLRENIVFRLYDGRGAEIHLKSGSGTDYNYNGCPMSIVTYCDMVVEKSSDKKMVALAKAVKDYGTAAQLYFGYKADGLSVSNRVKNLDKNKVIDGYSHVITGEMPSGFAGFKNMTLALESATELRIYMGYDENVGPGRFAYAIDGTSTKVTKTKDGQAYLSVMNIAARNLDQVYTFTVKGGTKTLKLKASALSYAALLCKQTKNKPVNLGKAMYLYNVAAKEYFAK